MPELSTVGKSIPRVDALEKVTGKAKYCSDFKLPGLLFAKIVPSPHPHARVLRINAAPAERLPGVRAVVTPDDVGDVRLGAYLNDELVLPRDGVVRCVGQAVAVVVAETSDIAEEGVDLVDVDYEELPAVFDPEEALGENPPVVVHPEMAEGAFASSRFPFRFDPKMPNCAMHYKVRRGDIEKGYAESDLIIEDRYSTARMAHCCMETHRVDAWVEPDGTLSLRMSTQTPSVIQDSRLAVLFGVPQNKIRVMTPYIGGGFGGKVGDDGLQAPLALLAAIKTGRPVRLENTRAEEFIGGRHRAGIVTHIKDGFRSDGTLVARQMKVILDLGRHAGVGYLVARNMVFGAVGTYRVPNFRWDGYGVYTNSPVVGAFRGFGSPEVIWAIEQQMDIAAQKLGIDPVEIRQRNILRDGEKDVCGQTTVANGASACLDRVAQWIGWGEPSQSDGVWKRGKGIGVGNKYSTTLPSAATVKINRDGTIQVRHGNVEVGQGLNTLLSQIAAEELKVPVENVKIVYGDTAVCPPDYGAVSSRSTFFTGNAVRLACRDAKRRLLELASGKLGASAGTLDMKDGRVFPVSQPETSIGLGELFAAVGVPVRGGEVIGTATFLVPTIPEHPETGQSERLVAYFSHFAHAVEVAVNVETGEIKVLRIVSAADGGVIVNPAMAEAQVEGGFHQGIGASVYEQIALENGAVTNANFADYKMPTAREMPLNRDVKAILSPSPHPEGPFGAKGLGEGVIVAIAPAIGNAVFNATGVRIKDLPLSRERVWKACRDQATNQD